MTKVLITDNAAFMLVRMKSLLVKEGFEVIQAQTGQEAIDMYRDNQPDIVVMDLALTEAEWLYSVRTIQEMDPQARLIMLSSIGQEAELIEAIRLGARDFVIKPINQYCLFQKIHNLEQVCA